MRGSILSEDKGIILGNMPVKTDRGICVICKVQLLNLTEYDPDDEKPDYYILECPK